jgi:4-amino-4-deoxy-L-arabinose transferase-like glycosyltransferase
MFAGVIRLRDAEGHAEEAWRNDRLSAFVWVAVAAVCGVWFLTLGARHLLPSDEGRYAEIAREMFESGDWTTIRYNGLKYFEKPPLHLWATALAYQAFGVGDWQARLWSAISGAGGVVIAAFAARRWYGNRAALLTGCVLLSAPAWNIAGHFNSLDIGVSFALTGVMGGILVAQHPLATSAQRRRWMWFAWAAVGIAILSKGLIGIVLPVLAVIVYCLAARDRSLWRRLHIASGTAVMLLIAAPWFVLVSLRNPEFPQFFFIHEHWQRYTSNIHNRGGAWWYFVPQLVIGFLPWLGLAPRLFRAARHDRPAGTFRPALFVALWAVAIFVFFSVSDSKLPGYIIPIYPALAILAAIALERMEPHAWERQIYAMLVVTSVGLLATPFIARLGSDPESTAAYHAFAPWVGAACAIGIAGLAGARFLNRRDLTTSIVVYSLSFFALITVALLGHESFGRNSSGVLLVAPIRAVVGPDMPIYSVRMLDHTLPFYLRRITVMVEAPDELDFGTRQEPDKWMPTVDAFLRAWRSPRKAAAIMSHDTFASLREQGVVMFPVAEDSRRVVVTNFERPAP